MTPDQIRAITDPAAREHAARAALGQATDQQLSLAVIRREALLELHTQLGSWRKVGERVGITSQAAWKAAQKGTR